jgi:hypothetical protein
VLKVHNEQFYHALFDFSQNAIDLLKNAERPNLTRRKFKIIDSEKPSWDWIESFDYERLLTI